MAAASRFRPSAYAGLVLLSTCLATRALASCPFGISPETAQRLFDRVKNMSIGDGYRFEGVSTNKTELFVLWSLDGVACPPIRVDVENCTPLFGLPAFQLEVPPDLPARCPGLQAAVQELSSAVPQEFPVGRQHSLAVSALSPLIAVIVLIVVVGFLIRRLLRPVGGKAFVWSGVGWIAFVVALATWFFFNPPAAVTVGLGIAWVIFAVLLFDRDRLRGESRTLKLSLLGLFVFSLLLNCTLSSGGPGDLRLNLAGIWSPELELRWGPAPVALFRLLGFAMGGVWDTHIFWCNVILSSVLPIVLYGIVSDLGVNKAAALVAAFVVAAHPFLIAFSGVLERQATCRFAAFGSILALISFLKRGGGNSFVAFVLGIVLATTSRPEGAQVLVLNVAVLLALPASRRARGAAALALAVLVLLAVAYVHALDSKFPGDGNTLLLRAPLLWTVVFSHDFTPLAWIVAWTLGLVLGVRRRAAWVAVIALVGLDLIWRWTGVYHMFVGHERQIASARYESILLVPFAIGMALLIQAVFKARRWLKASLVVTFVVFTATTFRRPFDVLLRPFTVDYEYQFLKRYALTLPPQSRLYVLDSPLDDIGLLDAHLVGQFVGSSVDFVAWSDRRCADLLRDPSQTYLYVGSSCAELVDAPARPLPSPDYERWLLDCASIRARVEGDAVEEIDVPGRKMSWHDFKGRTVRLALYRLKDPSICALGPRYPWRSSH